jgi:hypothetical protein
MAVLMPAAHPSLVSTRDGEVEKFLTPDGSVVPLDSLQAEILRRLDGKTSVETVAEQLSAQLEGELAASDVRELVHAFREQGMLTFWSVGPRHVEAAARRCRWVLKRLQAEGLPPAGADVALAEAGAQLTAALAASRPMEAFQAAAVLRTQAAVLPWVQRTCTLVEQLDARSWREGLDPLFLTFSLVNPLALLRALDRWLGWIWTRTGALLCLLFAGSAGVLALWRPPRLDDTPLDARVWCVVVGVFVFRMLVHELAHGLACVHFGGRPNRMGVGLMYGVLPFAYVDTTSMALIQERWKRCVVILAGLGGSFIALATSLYMSHLLPHGGALRQAVVLEMGLVGVVELLANLNPLLKLDGYYLLVELTQMEDLRTRAFSLLRAKLTPGAQPGMEPQAGSSPKEQRLLLLYALLSVVGVPWVLVWAALLLWRLAGPRWHGAVLWGTVAMVMLAFGAAWYRHGPRRARRVTPKGTPGCAAE